jgi:hypothetical protein
MASIVGDDMVQRGARGLLLAGVGTLLSLAAYAAAPHLGIYLKTYYTDYEIIKECTAHSRLSAGDAEAAKAALAKIEAYYLHRDPSIKKDVLIKQATSNKDAAFKMMQATQKVDLRQFCRAALNDLTDKLHDVESGVAPGKASPPATK